MSQNPTENLRRGRRRIEEIPEIILLKDWTWDVVTKRFYLHIRVCLDHDGKDNFSKSFKGTQGRFL